MNDDQVLHDIRNAVNARRIRWSGHALERILERRISRRRVVHAVLNGDVIESYPDDLPFPSVLIVELSDYPLHAVVGYDESLNEAHIVTAYRPDLHHFETDYKTRRKR